MCWGKRKMTRSLREGIRSRSGVSEPFWISTVQQRTRVYLEDCTVVLMYSYMCLMSTGLENKLYLVNTASWWACLNLAKCDRAVSEQSRSLSYQDPFISWPPSSCWSRAYKQRVQQRVPYCVLSSKGYGLMGKRRVAIRCL